MYSHAERSEAAKIFNIMSSRLVFKSIIYLHGLLSSSWDSNFKVGIQDSL